LEKLELLPYTAIRRQRLLEALDRLETEKRFKLFPRTERLGTSDLRASGHGGGASILLYCL